MITKEQLKNEIDALEDEQTLELVYQLLQKLKISSLSHNEAISEKRAQQQAAMADFFGMHKELGIDSVESELRLIRKGRRGIDSDIRH